MKKRIYKWIFEKVTPVRANAFVAFIFILYLWMSKESYGLGSLVSVDVVSSVSVTAIVAMVITAIVKYCGRKIEDYLKLEEDASKLLEIYKQQPSLRVLINLQEICLPISALAWNSKGLHIQINDVKEKHQRGSFVDANYIRLFEAHKYSVVYNRLMIRLSGCDVCSDMVKLRTSRTMYFDSLVTNRSADTLITKRVSIRSVFEPGPKLTPLEDSSLSNHLGINGMVMTSDKKMIFVKRLDNLSVAKDTLACSCAASLKTEYALNKCGWFNESGLESAIRNELENELGLKTTDYSFDINKNIVGLVRSYPEVGKPDFCFYIKTYIDSHTFVRQFKEHKEKNKSNKMLLRDADILVPAELKDITIISANEVSIQGKKYPITPISIAALAALVESDKREETGVRPFLCGGEG